MEAATPHEQLREWRISKDLTQEALGERIGCSKVQVCRIERRQRNPGRKVAARIQELTARSKTPIRVGDWP